MKPPRPTLLSCLACSAASLVLIASTGCGGGSSSGPGPVGPRAGLRVPGPATGGASGDALAAALLTSTGATVSRTGQEPLPSADPELRNALAFLAGQHLVATALATGTGPRLEGSAYIRRLAAQHGAPADENGNGTNLDETLDVEFARIAETAGASGLPAIQPILFSWRDGTSELLGNPGAAGSESLEAYRAVAPGLKVIDTEQIGHAMMARSLAASRLLRTGRGAFAGATPEDGVRGLLLLQQVVAMEETLMANLFHDGAAMGRLANPSEYDPRFNTPRWLPRAFTAIDDPQLAGAPVAWVPYDQASSLAALSSVLTAASQLAWMASAANPSHVLRDALRGRPFGAPPPPKLVFPAAVSAATAVAETEVTWEENIKELLAKDCLVCHGGQYLFNEFSVVSYETVLEGGTHQSTNPIVVRGDPENSLLYQVVVGPMPQIGVSQMPLAGGPLEPEEMQLIFDWIEGGAQRGGPPGPPRVGLDLAQVLVRNLAELHMDPATGALHDRHEGDEPSGYAMASSTGAALKALAAYVIAVPADPQGVDVLDRAAGYAMQRLAGSNGVAVDVVEIATGEAQLARTDLLGQARLTAGLLAAGRALGRGDVLDRGRALAARLLDTFLDAATGLFLSDLRRSGRRYTPVQLAAVVDALRAIAVDGVVPGADRAHDRFLAQLRPHLAFSEWEGRGEVLGDGIPDTDGNGILEPGAAGGATGRAPVFAAEILEGPPPVAEPLSTPVTWSEHVQPLFRAKCAACHFDGALQGDYAMDTPRRLRVPGESRGSGLSLVVPGRPEVSLLYHKIADRNPPIGVQMPQALPPMSAEAKELVRRWIEEGATSR